MKKVVLIMLSVLVIGGCKKTKTEAVVLDGTYSGKVTYINGMSALAMPLVFNVSFQITSQPKTFTGVQNVNYLQTGAGTYNLSGQDIDFTNTQAFPNNTTVNTIAVLSGSYHYAIKGDSLFLTKNNTGINNTTYQLKKQ